MSQVWDTIGTLSDHTTALALLTSDSPHEGTSRVRGLGCVSHHSPPYGLCSLLCTFQDSAGCIHTQGPSAQPNQGGLAVPWLGFASMTIQSLRLGQRGAHLPVYPLMRCFTRHCHTTDHSWDIPSSSYPGGNFGRNQLLDGSIGLSPPCPVGTTQFARQDSG